MAQDERPNIVFIMADDLGNAHLGYRGGEVETPNIDQLAAEGVRLEQFYGMPVVHALAGRAHDRPLSNAPGAADGGAFSSHT